jgi:hypothetical protein
MDQRTHSYITEENDMSSYIKDGRNLMEQNRGRTDFRKVNLNNSPGKNRISSRTNDFQERTLSL